MSVRLKKWPLFLINLSFAPAKPKGEEKEEEKEELPPFLKIPITKFCQVLSSSDDDDGTVAEEKNQKPTFIFVIIINNSQ